jgi:hypothetical protein
MLHLSNGGGMRGLHVSHERCAKGLKSGRFYRLPGLRLKYFSNLSFSSLN